MVAAASLPDTAARSSEGPLEATQDLLPASSKERNGFLRQPTDDERAARSFSEVYVRIESRVLNCGGLTLDSGRRRSPVVRGSQDPSVVCVCVESLKQEIDARQ